MEFWSYQLRFLWYFSGVKFLSSLIKIFSLLMNRLKSLSWSSLLFGGTVALFWRSLKALKNIRTISKKGELEKLTDGFLRYSVTVILILSRTCAYQGVSNVSFSESLAYVLNGWPLIVDIGKLFAIGFPVSSSLFRFNKLNL